MGATKLVFRLIAATALLAGSFAANAEIRKTSAFTVDVPAGWELQVKEPSSANGKLGTWVFVNPSRDIRLFIRIGSYRPGPIAKQWDAFIGERLSQSLKHIRPEGFWQKRDDSGEIAFGTVYGAGRRNQNGHIYKYAIALMRHPSRKRVAYIALGGTKVGWGRASLRLDRILQTLSLR
jgi:hypothetical protein